MTDEHADLADYLLGELAPSESERVQRRLSDDPRFAEQVRSLVPLVETLSALPHDAWPPPMQAPTPAHADRTAHTERAPARSDRRRHRWPGRRSRTARHAPRALLSTAAATAVVAVIVALLAGGGANPRPTIVLHALAGAPSNSIADATMTGPRRMTVTFAHLPTTDRGHYYALWLMTSATDLVRIAAFRVDSRGNARLSVKLPAPPGRYRYLDVSLQRARDGGQISNDSVLRGPIAS